MQAHYETNKILIDWLSFTISDVDIDDLIVLLGMENITFASVKGGRGYKDRYYYDGVSIHYNGGDDNRDLWVEMSGQGCRVFETYGHGDWIYLLSSILQYNVNITRLDVAYDDFNNYLDLDSIVADTLMHNYVTKADDKSWDVHLSGQGTCVTIGKSKSQISVRIYDKAAERNRQDEITHWVRCELQLRYQSAHQFCVLLCNHQVIMPTVALDSAWQGVNISKGFSIDKLYFGVLNNYLRYVDKEANNDSNLWRKPLASHWAVFARSVTDERISLWVKPGVEYNILKLDNYVERMCSGAVVTYAIIHGIDQLVSKLVDRLPYLNVKYEHLIRSKYSDPDIIANLLPSHGGCYEY